MLTTSHAEPINTSTVVAAPVVSPGRTSVATDVSNTREIKVLHIINGEHFSGAERVQQLLGRNLPEYGVQPTFACVKPGKFPEVCGLNEQQILQVPMRNRIDLNVVRQLSQIVFSEQFQILHAHTPRTALVTSMVSLRTGIPWCYHVHSPAARDSTRGLVNRINDWIERYSIRSCTQLLTVSKSLRREMLGLGVQRNRLSVVPNGVAPIDPIVPGQRMNAHCWRLGLIALMRPRKGVEVALEALAQLDQPAPRVELELIGGFETPEYEHQILEMIKDLKLTERVHWTGFTRDVATAIRRLDALVLPSLFGEGMPMVVLEALAAAVPVVATKVEGTPEVIRHGIEGLLAEPQDAMSLAHQIRQMTADRNNWSEMSTRALIRHREKFTDRLMARRVAQVYRSILRDPL